MGSIILLCMLLTFSIYLVLYRLAKHIYKTKKQGEKPLTDKETNDYNKIFHPTLYKKIDYNEDKTITERNLLTDISPIGSK